MPQYSPALDALRRPSRVRTFSDEEGMLYPDPSLELEGFQRGMGSEIRDRIFNEMRSGAADPDRVSALNFLRESNAQDIAASPLRRQEAEVDFWRDQNAKGIAGGFGGVNPAQEAAAYERRIGEEKLRQPIQVQQMADQAALQRQRLIGEQQKDLYRQQHEQTLELGQRVPQLFTAAPGQRSSYNPRTGAFSVGQTYAPGGGQSGPTGSVLNQLTTARNAMEQARSGGGGLLGTLGSLVGIEPGESDEFKARQNTYNQALGNVLMQMGPGALEVQEFFNDIYQRNPNIDINQLAEYYAGIGQPFTPDEIEVMRALQYFNRIGQQ